MENQHIKELKQHYDKTIDHLKDELKGLRTGRASVSLVEDMSVESYGTKSPLKQIASLSVADAKTIVVQPWDKSVLGEIEKAINNSDKGFSVLNDGNVLRLVLPDMSEDRRQEVIKVLHQKMEAARIAIREVRDKIRDKVGELEKNKEISEDDKFRIFENIDKITGEYNDKIKSIGQNKEEEIKQI